MRVPGWLSSLNLGPVLTPTHWLTLINEGGGIHPSLTTLSLSCNPVGPTEDTKLPMRSKFHMGSNLICATPT